MAHDDFERILDRIKRISVCCALVLATVCIVLGIRQINGKFSGEEPSPSDDSSLSETSTDSDLFRFSTEESVLALAEETVPASCSNVTDVLKYWNFPSLSFSKFLLVENIFRLNYYRPEDFADLQALTSSTLKNYANEQLRTVDPTNTTSVTDAMICAFLSAAGDKYCIYRNESQTEEYETDLSGQFAGIGIIISQDKVTNVFTITGLIQGGPAESAGILPYDILTHVGGVSVGDLGYERVVSNVRGEIGTDVTVTVLRGEESIDFTITRAIIEEQSVSFDMTTENYAYISISAFNDNTGTQVMSAIDSAVKAGAVGVIFDLRNNPGGYLHAVLAALDYIIPDGDVIASYGSKYAPYIADDGHEWIIPTVVLCNQSTASAGELFTSALRDYSTMGILDVTTVGVTTYGKGIMQSSWNLGDGSTVTLTVASYNPPSGVNYHGIGIVPDVTVKYNGSGSDNQLAEAKRVLSDMIAEEPAA